MPATSSTAPVTEKQVTAIATRNAEAYGEVVLLMMRERTPGWRGHQSRSDESKQGYVFSDAARTGALHTLRRLTIGVIAILHRAAAPAAYSCTAGRSQPRRDKHTSPSLFHAAQACGALQKGHQREGNPE